MEIREYVIPQITASSSSHFERNATAALLAI
jgi:hypothetical protein